jgi:hypothetical protein
MAIRQGVIHEQQARFDVISPKGIFRNPPIGFPLFHLIPTCRFGLINNVCVVRDIGTVLKLAA